MTYTKGIDISHWNAFESPQRAWEAGARFVIIRLGSIASLTGECYTDYDLENNMALFKDWNANNPDKIIPVAGYYYGRLNHDVVKQAQFVADMVDYCEFDLGVKIGFVVWDQEEAGLSSILNQAMIETEQRSGKICTLYTNANTWLYLLTGNKDWAVFVDLWQAQWTIANEPQLLDPWKTAGLMWSLWQYSSKNGLGKVFGGAGYPEGTADMDLNYFNGSYEEMYDYFNYSPDEPLPPEPDPEPEYPKTVKVDYPSNLLAGVKVYGAPSWNGPVIGHIEKGAEVSAVGSPIGAGEGFYPVIVYVPVSKMVDVVEGE